jgi:RNA polymerase sigma-70 factor (ECF subfamily)
MAAADAAAFASFYDRYAPLAYGLILRIVGEPADAADVLQDVFWEAWQTAVGYDPARGTPEAWILVRARARAIDRVRAVRRRSRTFVEPVDEATDPAAAVPGADVAEQAAARTTVAGALGALTDVQREVIELAYWEGLTQSEIADRLKQPLGTVKTRMRLGLDRLREVLRGRFA